MLGSGVKVCPLAPPSDKKLIKLSLARSTALAANLIVLASTTST